WSCRCGSSHRRAWRGQRALHQLSCLLLRKPSDANPSHRWSRCTWPVVTVRPPFRQGLLCPRLCSCRFRYPRFFCLYFARSWILRLLLRIPWRPTVTPVPVRMHRAILALNRVYFTEPKLLKPNRLSAVCPHFLLYHSRADTRLSECVTLVRFTDSKMVQNSI